MRAIKVPAPPFKYEKFNKTCMMQLTKATYRTVAVEMKGLEVYKRKTGYRVK